METTETISCAKSFINRFIDADIKNLSKIYSRRKVKDFNKVHNIVKKYCEKNSYEYQMYYNEKDYYWAFDIQQPNDCIRIYMNIESRRVEIFFHCYIIKINMTNSYLKDILTTYLNNEDIWNMSWNKYEEY